MTAAAQAVVEHSDYSSFGVLTRDGTTVRQPFAYTGREWDVELGLYYYRARYYDPEVGRFLSRDPLGLAAGPNPYTYVENSPTNYLDPSGQVVDICRSMRPWNDQCFVSHYWRGFGRTVDVIEVGLLQALRAAKGTKDALQATQARIQTGAARQASTLCEDCDKNKGSKPFTFGTDRRRFERDFTDEPGLFVYGNGYLYTSSACSGTANCQTRTCSFECDITVDVPDKFEDVFSCRERFGPGHSCDVGIPYNMKARWVEQWAGAVGF